MVLVVKSGPRNLRLSKSVSVTGQTSSGNQKSHNRPTSKVIARQCWVFFHCLTSKSKLLMVFLGLMGLLHLEFFFTASSSLTTGDVETRLYLPARPQSIILENVYRTTHSFTTCNTSSSMGDMAAWVPTNSQELSDHEELGIIKDRKYYEKNRRILDSELTGCPFIADWQTNTGAYPTCNLLHEFDGLQMGYHPGPMYRIEHLANGGNKDVWGVLLEDDTTSPDFVLKTTRYNIDFVDRHLDKDRIDALIMGQATASPYVMNMYAYCAFSNLVERSSMSLSDWIRTKQETAKPLELLQLAYQAAQGLADMHLFHKNGLPTVAHGDIKTSQFLYAPTTGVYKVNDFNNGRLLTSKGHPPGVCPFPSTHVWNSRTNHAPEEYKMDGQQLADRADVFTLGSLFYTLLTGNAPFIVGAHSKKPSPQALEEAIQEIVDGNEPFLPSSIVKSEDPSYVAIVDAMRWCRQYYAKDRPSSQQVAERLKEALEKVQQY
jgi:hypothetical protein